MINIILAEDHNIVRNGIRSLLEKEPQFKIIGEAVNGKEVLDMLNAGLKPDIILADMNMPVLNGLELVGKLHSAAHQAKVIILTMLDLEKYVVQAFKSGASGYLLKSISADEMVFAIKHIHEDGRYVCSELALRFLDRLVLLPDQGAKNESDVDFSKRELEVLTLIAEGFTNQEIADKLFTSKRTVEGHRQSLIDKTDARNTAALIKFAMLNGIIG